MPGGQAHASEPRVVSVQPAVRDGKLQIDADVEFELNQQLRDAAQRGVPLYFTADLTVTRDRWWWFNKSLVDTTRTWRVTYNADAAMAGGRGRAELPRGLAGRRHERDPAHPQLAGGRRRRFR